MKIESRKISELANDPNNARTHDEKNLAAIKGSLAKFKQQKPIVIDKNNVVIAGNGTLQAAKELGWESIDVVVTTLDKWDKTAFALADNRTAELADWDSTVLDEQLKALDDIDFDIGDIGFDLNHDEDDFVFKDPGEPNDTKLEDNKITVTCSSLDEKDKLFSELNERGFKVK